MQHFMQNQDDNTNNSASNNSRQGDHNQDQNKENNSDDDTHQDRNVETTWSNCVIHDQQQQTFPTSSVVFFNGTRRNEMCNSVRHRIYNFI